MVNGQVEWESVAVHAEEQTEVKMTHEVPEHKRFHCRAEKTKRPNTKAFWMTINTWLRLCGVHWDEDVWPAVVGHCL